MLMEKVSTILSLEAPKNIHDLQIFLGMMVWLEIYTEAFELCKRLLTNAPVRGYAVPGAPY